MFQARYNGLAWTRKASVLSIALACAAMTSCGGAGSVDAEDKDGQSDGADLEGVPFSREVEHDTCLFITHQVKDFDLWKASFDLASSVRAEHGIHTLGVYKEQADSSLALVLTSVDRLRSAKDYITSEDLTAALETAGVQGEMELFWMAQQMRYTKPVTDSIWMFMSFKVMSYERWEKAFLQDYRDEPNRDFQVAMVLRGTEDPDQVSMVFAVNDHNYVQKMESNNAFRMKMLAAGVVSYPVIYKLREVPI